ncbi:MAG TPA: MBL fold metallo-hydrolase [Burkholderiales bacterium]|nr:MBL fold metallo-hydrolase [Burkholderiales bacterium]
MTPLVKGFYEPITSTITYVVYEKPEFPCIIIDSVLDYDPASGRTRTVFADKVAAFVRENELVVEWILETHAHADHLTAAPYLKRSLGGKITIGENIRTVQGVFKKVFHLVDHFHADGQQFDHLIREGEALAFGNLQVNAIFTPGHTPADMAYQIGDCVFVGDTLFMPDVGTARCDFPGGDARVLYHSVRKLLSLPDQTRLFMCHDYAPVGREPSWETTVAEQRARNIHIHDGVSEEAFVTMREARDRTLDMPTLILPSIQVNIRAGEFPPAEANGVHYLKIPVNVL